MGTDPYLLKAWFIRSSLSYQSYLIFERWMSWRKADHVEKTMSVVICERSAVSNCGIRQNQIWINCQVLLKLTTCTSSSRSPGGSGSSCRSIWQVSIPFRLSCLSFSSHARINSKWAPYKGFEKWEIQYVQSAMSVLPCPASCVCLDSPPSTKKII